MLLVVETSENFQDAIKIFKNTVIIRNSVLMS